MEGGTGSLHNKENSDKNEKILILGANSYIGTSFHNYLTTKYPGQYQADIVSLRGDAWKAIDWSGYDSVMNVTGKAHADISSLTEEQKQEYYAINCDLAVEAAKRSLQTVPHSMPTSVASLSTETAVTVGNRSGSRRIRSRLLPILWGQQMAGGTEAAGIVRSGSVHRDKAGNLTPPHDLRPRLQGELQGVGQNGTEAALVPDLP